MKGEQDERGGAKPGVLPETWLGPFFLSRKLCLHSARTWISDCILQSLNARKDWGKGWEACTGMDLLEQHGARNCKRFSSLHVPIHLHLRCRGKARAREGGFLSLPRGYACCAGCCFGRLCSSLAAPPRMRSFTRRAGGPRKETRRRRRTAIRAGEGPVCRRGLWTSSVGGRMRREKETSRSLWLRFYV